MAAPGSHCYPMHPQPRRRLYVSEYMALKAQMETLLLAQRELQAKLDTTRRAELEAEAADMRKRIAAFGITPDMLFSKPDLRTAGAARGRPKADANFGQRKPAAGDGRYGTK